MDVNYAWQGMVDFTRHCLFTDGDEITSSTMPRFRAESELRATVEAAVFDVDTVYGGRSGSPLTQVRKGN